MSSTLLVTREPYKGIYSSLMATGLKTSVYSIIQRVRKMLFFIIMEFGEHAQSVLSMVT